MVKSIWNPTNKAPATLMTQLVEEWTAAGQQIKDQSQMILSLRHDRSDLRDHVNKLNDQLDEAEKFRATMDTAVLVSENAKLRQYNENQSRSIDALGKANHELLKTNDRLSKENTMLIEHITELLQSTVDEHQLRHHIAKTLDEETFAGVDQCQDIAQAIIDMLIKEGIATQLE